MADFDEKWDQVYQYFKEAMDRLEKLEEQEKEADKKSFPRLTLEMGGMRQLDAQEEYRNHLAYTKQRIKADLDHKLDHYYQEANLSPESQEAARQALQARYKQEKIKTFYQSQDYLSQKLEKGEQDRDETNRSLEQSQDYANILLLQAKGQTQTQTKVNESPAPILDGSGNYNYTMNLSFNKLEQSLEDKVSVEKESEKEVERE